MRKKNRVVNECLLIFLAFIGDLEAEAPVQKLSSLTNLKLVETWARNKKGWTEGESFPPSIEDEISYVGSGSQL